MTKTEKVTIGNSDVLHGKTRYKKGRSYNLDAEVAAYFRNNGWLKGAASIPPGLEDVVTLDIHDVHQTMNSEVK